MASLLASVRPMWTGSQRTPLTTLEFRAAELHDGGLLTEVLRPRRFEDKSNVKVPWDLTIPRHHYAREDSNL